MKTGRGLYRDTHRNMRIEKDRYTAREIWIGGRKTEGERGGRRRDRRKQLRSEEDENLTKS